MVQVQTYMVSDKIAQQAEQMLNRLGHRLINPVFWEAVLFEAEVGQWDAAAIVSRYRSYVRDRAKRDAQNNFSRLIDDD